jgi:hypothetical protein
MELIAGAALALALAMTVLWFATRAAITICIAEFEKGKVRIVSGGIAPRVLDDVKDVVKRGRVKAATMRIVRSRGRAHVEIKGDILPDVTQQLRNVVGSVPFAKLINARKNA